MEDINKLHKLLTDINFIFQKLFDDFNNSIRWDNLIHEKIDCICKIIIKIRCNLYISTQKGCSFSINKYCISIMDINRDLNCYYIIIRFPSMETEYKENSIYTEYYKLCGIDLDIDTFAIDKPFKIDNYYDKLYNQEINILILILSAEHKLHYKDRLPQEIYNLIYNEYIK